MTEILSGVWEIEFQDVSDDHWAFKFAIDGSWSYNFGVKSNSGADYDDGAIYDAAYNGGNIEFDTFDSCSVKIWLDLRDYDSGKRTGARFAIDVMYEDDEPIVNPFDDPSDYAGKINVSADASFEGYTLKLSDKTGSVVSRIIRDGEALFSGVNGRNTYSLALYNKNGRMICGKENIALVNDEASVSFGAENLHSAEVRVNAADGTELNDYTVEWFVGSALTAESTDAAVNNLNAGDKVTCRVKLGDSMKKLYDDPAPVTRTIGAADETFEFTLQQAQTNDVTIRVSDEAGSPVPSASVSIVQRIDSKSNYAENYTADENGQLTVALREVDTTVKVSEADYFAAVWSGVPDGSDISLTLRNAVGATLFPNVTFRYCDGSERSDTAGGNDSLTFEVFNLSKNKDITSFTYTSGKLTVPYSEVRNGDILELTATDSDGVFAENTAVVTYTESGAEFDLTLFEKEKATFGYTSANEENLALIFNSDMKRVETVYLNNGRQSGYLSAGSYSAVLIGDAETIACVPDYDTLLSYGLAEGTNFIKRDFSVSDGSVTGVSGVAIPASAKAPFSIPTARIPT